MRILVTGASGFIGRNLIPRLAERHEVFSIVRAVERTGQAEVVTAVEADLAKPLSPHTLPCVDVIVHLAQAQATFPAGANELFAVNTQATQQLLDFGRRTGARRFVLASTGDVYGWRIGPSKETDLLAPTSYYGVTKHAAESLVLAYATCLQPCILRFFHPYGSGQTGRLVPKLVDCVRTGRAVSLHHDDRPRMTPMYIDDVAVAIERAVNSSHAGAINIAGDAVVSIRDLAERLAGILKTAPVFTPSGETSSDRIGDNTLMKQVLGRWMMVPLHEGLERTLALEGAPS